MFYCLKGLEGLQNQIAPCVKDTVVLPQVDTFGLNEGTEIHVPDSKVDCDHTYGDNYMYMSCTGARPPQSYYHISKSLLNSLESD